MCLLLTRLNRVLQVCAECTRMQLLEGSGFAIATCLIVLVAGLLTYYINRRLAILERVIQKQNQVIAGLIGGVRGELVGGELGAVRAGPSCEAACPDALAAASGWAAPGCCQPRRLPVSDDDDGSSEGTGSSDESETSDEEEMAAASDGGEEHGGGGEDTASAGLRVVSLGSPAHLEHGEISVVMGEEDPEPVVAQLVEAGQHGSGPSDSSDTDSCLSEIGVVELSAGSGSATSGGVGGAQDDGGDGDEDDDDEDELAVESQLTATDGGAADGGDGDGSGTPISKRAVGRLRDMVVEQNLLSRTEAKKLRKPSLVSLLEPQQSG